MTKRPKVVLVAGMLLILLACTALVHFWDSIRAQPVRPTLYWGSRGSNVVLVQTKLKQWGYYDGVVDGVFGAGTSSAVKVFQRRNGLTSDGVVGPRTYAALGIPTSSPVRATAAAPTAVSSSDKVNLLARLIQAEAGAEPYTGQVAVGAVILNRVKSPSFPNTLAGVVYQPLAFESVSKGTIYAAPSASAIKAAGQALNGWDPTYGALFFWNPYKPVSAWIWSRNIITQIGKHVFAR